MRRWVTIGLVACAAAVWFVPATGHADDTDPVQAAREIADARDQANQANQAYFDQQSKVDQLDTDQADLTSRVAAAQRDVDALGVSAGQVAVNRYVSAGTGNLPLLDAFQSVDDQVQMRALIDVVSSGSADDYDRYKSALADLDSQQAALDAKRGEAAHEQRHLDDLRQDAIAQVEHLKAVQADRLNDDAVRTALAAEEAQRNRAAIQAAAASGSSQTTTTSSLPAGGANSDNGNPDGDDPSPAATATTVAGATTTTTSPVSGAGEIGGRATAITLPVPALIGGGNGDYGGPGWVCPTGQAAVSFSDTYGAPRSGGRRHEGVDLIGARGTPVLAVVDGVAVAKENVLGGMTISLTGTDGNRYYYAHLDGYVNLGDVTAGEQIGILGQTGNAQYSVPHLHFEIHPGGGPAVNPTPTAAAHCLGGR